MAAEIFGFRQNQGIFSRTSLAARKVGRGLTESQAAEHAAEAFAPLATDFNTLGDEFEIHRELYENTIGPIRNNVSAHSGRITDAEMRELFASVPMGDFDKLVVFPLVLNNEMWQLFENDNRPNLRAAPVDIAELVANPLRSSEIGLEHRIAVKYTSKFLERLESTPSGSSRGSREETD
jgi:hypothetical protein